MKRPFFLTLVTVFTVIMYGLLALLFLTGLVFVREFELIMLEYAPETNLARSAMKLLLVAGFFLHGAAIGGLMLMWNLRPSGYLLFAISSLLLAISHLFRPDLSWIFPLFYTTMVVIFGFFYLFLRRKRSAAKKKASVNEDADASNNGA